MIVYLLGLLLINAGGGSAAVLGLQSLVSDGRISAYDAKGYLVVAMLILTFLFSSLAYFWGVSRFGVPDVAAPGINGATVGLLFTACCCMGALGYGLSQLQAPERYR